MTPARSRAAAVGIDRGSIQAESLLLRSDLAELEASLIKDVILVATHPEIQTFDISLQRIDRMLTRRLPEDDGSRPKPLSRADAQESLRPTSTH